MNEVIPILQEVLIETDTAMKWIEFDDPVNDSFEYIKSMTRLAIEKLENDL